MILAGWRIDRILLMYKALKAAALSGIGKFYRSRDHEASPFFKVLRHQFDEFERVYPQKYQARYGYWRPVIRSSIDKFLKSGDLKEGFARVRCPDCNGVVPVDEVGVWLHGAAQKQDPETYPLPCRCAGRFTHFFGVCPVVRLNSRMK